MGPFLTILRWRWRSHRRWLVEHAYVILLLGPLIVGGGGWVLRHYARQLGGLAQLSEWRPPEGSWLAGGLLLAVSLSAVMLPGTLRELYPSRRGDEPLELWPVPPGIGFHVSLVAVAARHLVAGGLLFLLFGTLGAARGAAGHGGLILVATLALAPAHLAAGVVLVRWSALRSLPLLGLATLLVLAAIAAPGSALARFALAPWLASGRSLGAALFAAPPSAGGTLGGHLLPLAVSGGVAWGVGWALHRRWHRAGSERLRTVRRRRAQRRRRATRSTSPLSAQVRRDLLLLRRRFSPVVDLAVGLVLLVDLGVAAVVHQLPMHPFWASRLALVGCTVGVLAASGIVPFLLRYELPRFWLERSSGLARDAVWRSKLWLARLLALPAVGLGAAVLAAVGLWPARELLLAVAELALGGWIVASVVGLGAFEIAERPLLGLGYTSLVGMALASFVYLYPPFWWLGLLAFLWVASHMAQRAGARVAFTEAHG